MVAVYVQPTAGGVDVPTRAVRTVPGVVAVYVHLTAEGVDAFTRAAIQVHKAPTSAKLTVGTFNFDGPGNRLL